MFEQTLSRIFCEKKVHTITTKLPTYELNVNGFLIFLYSFVGYKKTK